MNIQPIYAKPFEFCCVVISLTIVALTAVLADSPLFADATVRIRQTKTNKQFPAPIKNPFANRFIKYDRKKWRDYNAKIMELGSSQATQAGIAKGLHWLVRTQHSSGAWKLDGKFKNPGAKNDIAGTALGLLPFLGVGKTHKASKTNPFDIPVKNGLLFLLKKQDKKTGYFGGGMYAHSMATMAICETYALTKDLNARRPAQHAIEYLIKAQHPGGGWRYKPGQAGDMSVSGWAIQAITTGKLAGLNVPDDLAKGGPIPRQRPRSTNRRLRIHKPRSHHNNDSGRFTLPSTAARLGCETPQNEKGN